MLNKWIMKRKTPREAMILGILENRQKDPNQVVKQGHQGA